MTLSPSSSKRIGASGASACAVVVDRLELVVLDLDELAAIFGQVPGLGDDERDRVADEPDLVARQCLVHGRPVAFDLEVEVERLREALQIGCRVDGNDPGKGRVPPSCRWT